MASFDPTFCSQLNWNGTLTGSGDRIREFLRQVLRASLRLCRRLLAKTGVGQDQHRTCEDPDDAQSSAIRRVPRVTSLSS